LGFVNWQGQRVFVPWFGALRIVLIAADEIPIRRNGERQHYVWALAFFPSVIAAFWIGDPDPMRGLVVGIALSLAFSWLRDYRHVRHWPKLAGRVGYWQFRLAYLRTQPTAVRLWWVGLSWVAALASAFLYWPLEVWLLQDPALTSLAVKLALVLAGPGVLAFFFLRDALIAAASLLPGQRASSTERTGCDV
jgi:hypothetical protein